MKEVWIPCLNKHRFWRCYFSVYSLVLFRLRGYIKYSRQYFFVDPNTSNFRQKHSASRRIFNCFNSLLGVWISRWNTVSRVWHMTSSQVKRRGITDLRSDHVTQAKYRGLGTRHSSPYVKMENNRTKCIKDVFTWSQSVNYSVAYSRWRSDLPGLESTLTIRVTCLDRSEMANQTE